MKKGCLKLSKLSRKDHKEKAQRSQSIDNKNFIS